jgi:NADH-quinone oxidoreductase subunit M
MTAVVFLAAIAWPMEIEGRRAWYAWLLFLLGASLGLFAALDLILFYVFFDLSLVGMYFLIGIWGHEDRHLAAIQFILFTLAGSLVMLLGILSLALANEPLTFDMRVLIAEQPLAGGGGLRPGLTLLALLFGLAVKTPLVPVHSWLPAAHVEAPAPASAILAGVLLKMGTFGMIRVPYAMMHDTIHRHALALGVVAVVSIVYGAFVALGQPHIKRRIAYTSITHMGYTVLGIAAAASLLAGHEDARRLALTGASLEMVAHGLITGALFLITGTIWRHAHAYDMNEFGGLASRTPRMTAAAVVASFASLGLPGLAGFVAEFQIFAGTLAVEPWLAGVGLIGVLITAALFLQLLQRVFLGPTSDLSSRMTDLDRAETLTLAVLLGLTILIGVAPAFIVDLLAAAAGILVRRA